MAKLKFGFYLDEEELKLLKKKAIKDRRSVGSFIRNNLFSKKKK